MEKSDFYNQNKKIFNIDDTDVKKIIALKKNNMVNIIHLNTLLGIMIMMLLDPYISQTTWYINKFEESKNSITTDFYNKTGFKEVPQEKVFINNSSRFYSLCIWKVLPTNIFRRM